MAYHKDSRVVTTKEFSQIPKPYTYAHPHTHAHAATVLILKSKASYFRLAGNEGMKNMETSLMGYVGTTMRIHSFIPS